jgi:hypothetical protein
VKKSKVNFAWYRLKMVSKIMLYSLEDESAELELIGLSTCEMQNLNFV